MKNGVLSIDFLQLFSFFENFLFCGKCGFWFDFLENNSYEKGKNGVFGTAGGKNLRFFRDFFVGKA